MLNNRHGGYPIFPERLKVYCVWCKNPYQQTYNAGTDNPNLAWYICPGCNKRNLIRWVPTAHLGINEQQERG